jgi:octaprenyl-diphosphate synthase
MVLAAILEWTHQVSLLLDDIIDHSTLRRNIQTLHTHTSTSFALGVSGHLASQLYSHLHSFPKNIQNNLLQSMVDLLQGQSTELENIAQWKLDLPAYMKIIEGKTASLFSFATQAGADLAKQPSFGKKLKEYGRLLGISFQIIDDVLDYTGDSASLGKNPGSDLQTQKISLPILLLRDELVDEERKTLYNIFSAPKTTEDDFQWVLSRIVHHDISGKSISIAREFAQQAREQLSALPRSTATELLQEITTLVTERSR